MAIKVKLNRYNEVAELMATDYTDELMEEMGQLQEELDAADAWDIDSQLEQAMDALRCPPPDEPVTHLSGGEKPPGGAVQAAAEQARPAAARRADQPPRRRERAVARTAPRRLQGRDPGGHPRPLLPGQRRRVDPRDSTAAGAYPYEGNYSTYLEKKAERLEVQGKKDQKLQKRLKEELAWVRSGAKARQAKNKARLGALRGDGRRGREDPQARLRGDPDPGSARGWATSSSRSSTSTRASTAAS